VRYAKREKVIGEAVEGRSSAAEPKSTRTMHSSGNCEVQEEKKAGFNTRLCKRSLKGQTYRGSGRGKDARR